MGGSIARHINSCYRDFFSVEPYTTEQNEEAFKKRDLARVNKNSTLEKAIKDDIVLHNLRLVITTVTNLAKGSKGFSESTFDDAVQEGTIGLMDAVTSFDVDKGTHFSTFAWNVITKAVWSHLLPASPISMPKEKLKDISKYTGAVCIVFNGNENMQDELGWSKAKLDKIKNASLLTNVASLEQTYTVDKDDRPCAIVDTVKGETDIENEVENKIMMSHVVKAFSVELEDKDIDVICRRFGLGKYSGQEQSAAQIAEIYGKTRQYIDRTIKTALSRIQKRLDTRVGENI